MTPFPSSSELYAVILEMNGWPLIFKIANPKLSRPIEPNFFCQQRVDTLFISSGPRASYLPDSIFTVGPERR